MNYQIYDKFLFTRQDFNRILFLYLLTLNFNKLPHVDFLEESIL